MNWMIKGSLLFGSTVGNLVARIFFSARGRGHWPNSGQGDGKERLWHVVTVNRPPEQVAPEGWLPAPLRQLGETVEVQLRPAPEDRGTELAARLRSGAPSGFSGTIARLSGHDPRLILRAALREAKQIVETGEVLSPDRPGTAEATPFNWPLRVADRRGRGEGRL